MEILLYLVRTNGDWVVAMARIVLGVIMFGHGAQKLLGWFSGQGFGNTVHALTTYVKLPKVLAVLVIFTEFFGGLGLTLGLLSRLAAFGILAVMVGSIFTVHYVHGLFMNWAGEKAGHGFEYHLLAIALALVVIIKGGGAFSIDYAVYEHEVDNRAAITQPNGNAVSLVGQDQTGGFWMNGQLSGKIGSASLHHHHCQGPRPRREYFQATLPLTRTGLA